MNYSLRRPSVCIARREERLIVMEKGICPYNWNSCQLNDLNGRDCK